MTGELVTYAGAEVFNTERLSAYLRNGITPGGGTTFDVTVCEGLAEAATGPSFVPYRTPIQDEPPWFDANDPDTWDFAGLIPLSITGLDSTTRTVSMEQALSGAGIPGEVQRGPQTFAVTALLVGRSTEGVKAGLGWLRRVLHGACDSGEQPCGPTGDLVVFTACPGPILASTDLGAPFTQTFDDPFGVSAPDWYITNGVFSDHGDGAQIEPYESVADVISGEGPAPASTIDVILSSPGVEDPVIWGGTPTTLGLATIATQTPVDPCTRPGPVTVTWRLRRLFAGVTAQPVILGANLQVTDSGPDFNLTGTFADYTWTLPSGPSTEDPWRPGLIVPPGVILDSLTVEGYLPAAAEDCIAPYRRRLPVTATTSGPTPVEVIDTGCVELMTVEWVWESGSPWRYGTPVPVLLGLGWGDAPTLTAAGVTAEEGDGVTPVDATPWNCTAFPAVSACGIDPAAPDLGSPPALPVITDTTRPRITVEDVRDVWALIGPEQTPANEGVLTIVLTAGAAPVVGARVRVWDNADALGAVEDECDFAYEFLIDYIPANGVLTIDGPAGTITTLCGGLPVPQDTSAGVRGAFGGPVQEPVVRCDRRYLVRLQWFDEYPRTAAPFYTLGDPNGALTMDLYVSTREG